MGLFDFVKDAGDKLFNKAEAKTPEAPDTDDVVKAMALEGQVRLLELPVEDLKIDYADGVATVRGTCPSQADTEKIVLVLGNTHGVSQVQDELVVEAPEPEPVATMYTVKSGDSLSKIAKAHYGDAMKYQIIFEANRPMLSDPNKIYPGQALRIPPLD